MPAPRRMALERASDLALIAAIALASAVLIDAGVVSSNDGSHYALVRAIGDTGSFVIDPYVAYTHDVDISEYGGHFFTDRPPGTAMLALPFYLASRLVSSDPLAWEFGAALLSAVMAALACGGAYWLALGLGLSRGGARALGITIAIATPLRSYGSTLFHHATAAGLVTMCAVLALDHAKNPRRITRVIAALIAGYTCSVDYTSCLATGVLLIAALVPLRKTPRVLGIALLEVVIAGIVGLVPLLAYDRACFGSALSLGYDHQVHFGMMHSMSGIYGGSMPDGLFGLFFHPRAGLVFWSPVLVLVFVYAPRLFRGEHRNAAIALALSMVPFVLLMSRYYEVGAGASRDARYITPIVPIFALPLAAAWDHATDRLSRFGRARLIVMYVVLATLSVELQVVKHLARWVRNGEFWIPQLSGPDVETTMAHFLTWSFPHPIAALVVLACGLSLSLALCRRAGEGTEP